MNRVLYIGYICYLLLVIAYYLSFMISQRTVEIGQHNQFKFDFSFYGLLLIHTSSTIVGRNRLFTNKNTLV